MSGGRGSSPAPISPAARRRRALLLVSLALACGGLAASQVASRVREVESAVGSPVPVVVMARDVPAGAELRPGDLAVRQVPQRFVPPDALAARQEAVGLPVAASLSRGSQLTAAAIGTPGGEGVDGTPGPLRRGQRAVEVAVAGGEALAAVAGPGSRVDVLISTEPGTGPGASFLALEDVELLAVGGPLASGGAGLDTAGSPAGGAATSEADAGGAAAATLRVTVRQAVYLTAAQNFAREVRLLPRPPGDRGRSGRTAVSADGL